MEHIALGRNTSQRCYTNQSNKNDILLYVTTCRNAVLPWSIEVVGLSSQTRWVGVLTAGTRQKSHLTLARKANTHSWKTPGLRFQVRLEQLSRDCSSCVFLKNVLSLHNWGEISNFRPIYVHSCGLRQTLRELARCFLQHVEVTASWFLREKKKIFNSIFSHDFCSMNLTHDSF